MSDFVKRADLDFVAQLNNFKNKIDNYKVVLGLTDPQVDSFKADAKYMVFVLEGSITANTYKQGWTSLKQDTRTGDAAVAAPALPIDPYPFPVDISMPPPSVAYGVEQRFRTLVGQIKASPAYTVSMGEDLGIVADESSVELTKPELTVKMEGGLPVIGFKKSKSDGIKLYSKRGSETTFSFLAVDTRSPYVDNRPNETPGTPETRAYYAYFIVNDEQVGDQSAEISLKV